MPIVSLIVFLLLLSLLVFVHELGHFSVARWCGMKVDEFAIGFPPRLFSRKRGDTLFAIGSIPLGGYVKLHGEDAHGDDAHDPEAFGSHPVSKRILVMLAGIAMNLLFALVTLAVALSFGFVSSHQRLADIPGSTIVRSQAYASAVQEGSGGAKAGVVPGDRLVRVVSVATSATTPVSSAEAFVAYGKSEQAAGNLEQRLTVADDSGERTVPVTLSASGPAFGIALDALEITRIPFWRAPGAAIVEIGGILSDTWQALSSFAGSFARTGTLSNQVSGPVGIYQATAAATNQGFISVLWLAVVLSVNLALLNLLPIPPLDGGKVVFLIVELVAGKRHGLAERIERGLTYAGMALLLLLMLSVSVKDVIRLF